MADKEGCSRPSSNEKLWFREQTLVAILYIILLGTPYIRLGGLYLLLLWFSALPEVQDLSRLSIILTFT